jgi:NAD(P)-dependent dehydrogenase (short-subunit alcohol dehydrogenase family)
MRVLVAGATGVIGASLVPQREAAGHKVIMVSRASGTDLLDRRAVRKAVHEAEQDAGHDGGVAARLRGHARCAQATACAGGSGPARRRRLGGRVHDRVAWRQQRPGQDGARLAPKVPELDRGLPGRARRAGCSRKGE